MQLQDKTAIITGGASGIGRAIALRFAAEGSSVMIGDVQTEPKSKHEQVPTHELITEDGGDAAFTRTDVSNESEVKDLVRSTDDEFGGIDILVNVAGIALMDPVDELTLEEWQQVLGVNLTGVFLCSKYALPFIRESSDGRVIHISSQRGLVGAADYAAYCASKGAVSNLTRQMAIDYGPDGITVNAICPGPIKTSLLEEVMEDDESLEWFLDSVVTPFVGEPEDVAHAAAFLASDEAKFVTGHNLVVDGGYTAK